MLNAPEPYLLQTFVAIVESGSFTGAAKRIHRTQSAVSMQIKRLEDLLGQPLFERSARNVRLTGEGEAFFDHARRILREYKTAMASFDSAPIEGEISIGMPDDYASSFLPRILASFTRVYDRVRLNIICEPSRQLMHHISDGSVDVALLTEGEASAGGTVVHREPLVWVTSTHHLAHEQDPVPLAVFHSGDVFRRHAIEQLEAFGRHGRIIVGSLSFAGIDAAVESGIAIAPVFKNSVRPGMRILTSKDGFPDLPKLGIVLQRSDREPLDLADRLSNHIVESFRHIHRRRK